MKYIDAEKLRAEIERRIKELDEQIVDIYDSKAVLRKDELQKLLSFLSTLESEKPTQEGLEKEYKDYVENDPVYSKLVNRNAGLSIARHFAEWGEKNAYKAIMKKADEVRDKRFDTDYEVKIESVSDDLEEAAMNYIAPIENEDGLKVINFSGQDIKDAFIAGAEWQKEKVLSLIESRISQIMGDAQPRPALRAELRDLIDLIKG